MRAIGPLPLSLCHSPCSLTPSQVARVPVVRFREGQGASCDRDFRGIVNIALSAGGKRREKFSAHQLIQLLNVVLAAVATSEEGSCG